MIVHRSEFGTVSRRLRPNPANIRNCLLHVPVSLLNRRISQNGLNNLNSPRIQPNPNFYRFLMIRGIRALCGIGACIYFHANMLI